MLLDYLRRIITFSLGVLLIVDTAVIDRSPDPLQFGVGLILIGILPVELLIKKHDTGG